MTGRKSPTILNDIVKKDGTCTQVLKGENIFVLGFRGKPVSMRLYQVLSEQAFYRYPKTSSTSLGTVERMVAKYNKLFRTNEFSILRVSQYEEVVRDPKHPVGSKWKTRP